MSPQKQTTHTAPTTCTSDNSHFEVHLDIDQDEQTVIQHLSDSTELSKQKLKLALSNGCVWHESAIGTHRVRRAKKVLHVGDKLHLYYDTDIQQHQTADAELIADHGDYSIWNKPYGMFSQGSKWGDHNTIYRYAETHLQPQRPAFLVHRLDRAANGLILIAHSKKAATALAKLFEHKKIIKNYRAVVTRDITRSDLVLHDIEDNKLPIVIGSAIDEKPAVSTILSAQSNGDGTSTLQINIETGRKHQIRRHLASLGIPVIGDRLYGDKSSDDSNENLNLQLQSYHIHFICPLTKQARAYTITA